MNKAFTCESAHDDPHDALDNDATRQLPAGTKNYITPQGYARLQAELLDLIDKQRPEVVQIVSWAAKNGDRSENGDYIYGKKRLREIDKRIRFLSKRLEISQVVDPTIHSGTERIFFGARVHYINQIGQETIVTIVGVDEIDVARNYISWRSPIAQALLKAHVGDQVTVTTPNGPEQLEILEVTYTALTNDC